MDYTAHYSSPLGMITMASDGERLIGVWFEGQRFFAKTLDTEYSEHPTLPIFNETRRWLDIYFAGRDPGFVPPLQMRASSFRKQVWTYLLGISFGQTTTYGTIAHSLKCPSAQAVGGAVAHNCFTLIVPCHRVVGNHNSLTGYAAGIDRKRMLLQHEQDGSNMFTQQNI